MFTRHIHIRPGVVVLAIGVAMALIATGCTSSSASSGPGSAGSVPASTVATATPVTTAVPGVVAPAPSTAATSAPSTGSAAATIKLVAVPGKSEARYRVREQLAQVSLPSDAIGKTDQVSGQIVGKKDGTIVASESKFTVDLTSLRSDRDQRDNFLRRNVLQTSQYPNATFVPKEASGLPTTVPPAGPVSFKLTGDLTVRNVTKSVTWDVNCTPAGNQGTCHATTSFKFEYFGMEPPRVPVVLSVVDNITLELDLALEAAS